MTTTFIPGNNNANIFASNPPVDSNNFSITTGSNVVIRAAAGNDFIDLTGVTNGSVSNFTVAAADGDDTITFATIANSALYLGAGSNTLIGNVNGTATSSLLQGQQGIANNFVLQGSISQSSVLTGSGFDSVTVTGLVNNNTTIAVGAGNDIVTLNGGVTSSTIYAGAGNDTVTIAGPTVTTLVQTSSGANLFNFGGAFTNNRLQGGVGADTINVTGNITGGSTIASGQGNDSITVANVFDSTIFAGDGNDRIRFGILSNSLIQSTSGSNVFTSSSSADSTNASIVGGSGLDTLSLAGGAYTDGFFDSAKITLTGIEVLGVAGGSAVTLGANAQIAGIVQIASQSNADTTTTINASAYSASILITSGAGADTLTSGRGRDTIIAGAGNDNITAGNGADFVNLTGGGTNTVNITKTSSVAATGSAIQTLDVGAFGQGLPTLQRWFGEGSTVSFGNGVDVITGVSASTNNITPGIVTFDDIIARTGYTTAATNTNNLTQLSFALSGTPAAGDTAFAGQLLGTAGTAVVGATYFVQGSFAGGVFTTGQSANFDPINGSVTTTDAQLGVNNDFLVFTLDSAADVNSFNISQPGTPNSFFQSTRSAFVIQDFSFA